MKYLGKIVDNKDLVTKEYVDNRSGVTGVKGSAESSYRTGQVNLTAANVGAAPTSHTHLPTQITQGQAAVSGSLDPLTQAMVGSAASNKTFGLPAAAIKIEYSTDGGSTWTDYGATDAQKKALFAETRGFWPVLGKSSSKDTNTVNNQLRITIEPTDRYVSVNGLYIWMSTSGNTVTVDLEHSTIGAKETFTTIFAGQGIAGWSGNNIRYFPGGQFGGGSTQTSNWYKYRLTFKQTAVNTNYNSASIGDIRFFGMSVWSNPNNMVVKNHMYTWDENLNVTFPAQVTATGGFSGNASTATLAADAGDQSMKVHPQSQNEVNFGGTSNSDTIYMGYRARDSKPIPAKFVFGGPSGTATIQAATFTGNVNGTAANVTGVVASANGGTGKTNLNDAANALINGLSTGSSDPTDNDYYVSQYAGGGTTTTTYHRRPVSALWNYIKGKISSVLGLTATQYGGNAATATNASKVNNLTVQTAVPANAKFTDTVTTATTSGSGNAVTAVTASNGALTVTKGTTFLTSHQDISGKADKSATVSTVTWDSTNKKLTKTINGTTSDVVTAATLRTGLNVADGAEVNQNAFSNVKVGSTTVAADSKTDTLELVAGSNVTLTPDATNDKVTIAATDTTYESKAAASGGTAVSLVTTGEKYTWNHKMSSIADVTNMELLTYEGITNDVMTVGLHDDEATSKIPVVNATTGKIPASVYNNTTYESKAAASGGTAVSLVTTGEKYTWNNKQATLVSGTNIKTINNTSLLGSGNINVGGGGGTTDYSDLSNKPQINSNTLSGNKTSADLGLQSALSVESQTLAVSSSFTLYTTTDATITLRRYGRVASVTGMVKPKSAITGSDTEYTICTVPTGYRPSQPIIQLMQGSTQYHWCLKVNTDGRVTFSRYSATTSYAQASTSTWLPFHATWIIG